MPPPTYLAWLQPVYSNFVLTCIYTLYLYRSKLIIFLINYFTCGKNFDKKYRAAAKLISNHENIKQQPHLISNHKLSNNCSLKKCIWEHKWLMKYLLAHFYHHVISVSFIFVSFVSLFFCHVMKPIPCIFISFVPLFFCYVERPIFCIFSFSFCSPVILRDLFLIYSLSLFFSSSDKFF